MCSETGGCDIRDFGNKFGRTGDVGGWEPVVEGCLLLSRRPKEDTDCFSVFVSKLN